MDWTFAIGNVSFGILDIVVMAICLLSAVYCCIRGFIEEFCHHAGNIIGIVCGLMFTATLTERLWPVMPEGFPRWATALISFVILTLVGYLIIRLLGTVLETIVETLNLGAINNILGFVWGLVAGLIVCVLIVYVLKSQTIFDLSTLLNSSVLSEGIIEPLMPATIGTIEEIIH